MSTGKILLTLLFTLLISQPLFAEKRASFENRDITVFFEPPLRHAAEEVISLYPGVRAGLEKDLGWPADFRVEVVLVSGSEGLSAGAGGGLMAAYAVPERYLMVIDNSKVHKKPLALETTLKHELCHILIHHHIREARVPRWLDEGLCQWAAGGVSEIMTPLKDSDLARASLSGNLIPLRELYRRFPEDEASLRLAYAQSRSFVEYVAKEHGSEGLLGVLDRMHGGSGADEAIRESLSVSAYELEEAWRARLAKRHTWLAYLSDNIYVLLFALGGALTVYGFIRLMMKRRAYRDEEEEEI